MYTKSTTVRKTTQGVVGRTLWITLYCLLNCRVYTYSMYGLFHNDMKPPLTLQEIVDFINTPIEDDGRFERAERYNEIQEYMKYEFWVPKNLSKKTYEWSLKETKREIKNLKWTIRETSSRAGDTIFLDIRLEKLIEKEKKIKQYLSRFIRDLLPEYDGTRLQKAKAVPIDTILDFKGGFAKCPIHKEKTASLKYYDKDNRWHCFGACSSGGDVIDLVMKMYNYTLPEAIKYLLHE